MKASLHAPNSGKGMWRHAKAATAATHHRTTAVSATSSTNAATPGVVTAGSLSSMSADLYESLSETTSIQGAGVLPYYYGVPAGRLYSQGTYVCDLEALQHLGISLEAGPIQLGKDHHAGMLVAVVLDRLERRHVGTWLLEAAANTEAADLFETHPKLQAWLHMLAEQKYGQYNYLLLQRSEHQAREAADWLQSLSGSFNRELHVIPVAYKHETHRSAAELLFKWLLAVPDYQNDPFMEPQSQATLLHLKNITETLPGRPQLLVKQVAGLQLRPLAGISARPDAAAAAAGAVAAGLVDGTPTICVGSHILQQHQALAAFQVIAAAQQGLKLSARECEHAMQAAVAGSSVPPAAPSAAATSPIAARPAADRVLAAADH